MANLNAGVRRWMSGGYLKIGADTVINMQGGSLEMMPPKRSAIPWEDRGVQQVPLDGDEERGSVKFSLKMGYDDATNLMTTLVTAPSASANATTYTLEIGIPVYRGASTGDKAILTNVFITKAPTWKAGTDFDTVEIEGEFLSWTAWASY